MTQGSGVLVVVEHARGELEPVTLEAVTAARALADIMGGKVTAGVIGGDVQRVSEEAATVAGVDEVVSVRDDRLTVFTGPAWTTGVAALVADVEPAVVLAVATTSGTDYLPRVAARLKAGHAANAVDVTVQDGKVIATRPVLESRALSSVAFENGGVATVTLRPGSFARAETRGGTASVRTIDVTFDEGDFTMSAEAPEGVAPGLQNLDSAERIVAGGRGLGTPDRFALVEELAAELKAAVASTRPLSDAGWRPHSDQIGQTGAHVSPSLYIAVGISGAVQHLVGVQNADYIVAINRDANAPIFKVASFGIVGDLFEVVPALVEQLRSAKA